MDNRQIIAQTFENQMRKKVYSIQKFENATNNSVYKIEADDRPYIFKVYSSSWPEEGKLPFVIHKLKEANIQHAEIYAYSRANEPFPHGYLIEECLPGTTADRLTLSMEETVMLFEKLAILVSQVHNIRLEGYGYTGGGIADYTSFSEHMYDVLKDNIPSITADGFVSSEDLESINYKLYEKLKVCDVFPSVLNHGDLSTKNIIVNMNDITLIDWDDVHSLCWLADIARLTLWMKLNYQENLADIYRKAFLNRYETQYEKEAFYEMEDALHVWYELDYLTFFTEGQMNKKVKALLRDSCKKCGIANSF